MNKTLWKRVRIKQDSIHWYIFAAGFCLLVAADRFAKVLVETYVLAFNVSPMDQNLFRLHGRIAQVFCITSLFLFLAAIGIRFYFVFKSDEKAPEPSSPRRPTAMG
jgi:hypothetical protein